MLKKRQEFTGKPQKTTKNHKKQMMREDEARQNKRKTTKTEVMKKKRKPPYLLFRNTAEDARMSRCSESVCQQRIQGIHSAGILAAGIGIYRHLTTETLQLPTGTDNILLTPRAQYDLLL